MLEELKPLKRAHFYDRYIDLVTNVDIVQELYEGLNYAVTFLNAIPEDMMEYRYAFGKWSIAQVVQHCADCEIIFNYRALTIAKENGPVSLPSFEEDDYVKATDVEALDKSDLIEYLTAVRVVTINTARMLTDEQLAKTGIANGNEIGVSSLFYCSSGHLRHHINVIRERYLNIEHHA